MNYRFATDPGNSQLQSYVDRLRSALPPGSLSGSANYLLIRNVFNITNSILTNVLAAFSVFALAATAAIVANLVTGMVISAYHEIGIMKAVGFTPLEVVSSLVLQILLPALGACLVGIPLGTVLSQPLLANSSKALGLAFSPSFSVPTDLLALAGVLLLVLLAAVLPALRAGLLKPGGGDGRCVNSAGWQRTVAPPPAGTAKAPAGRGARRWRGICPTVARDADDAGGPHRGHHSDRGRRAASQLRPTQ